MSTLTLDRVGKHYGKVEALRGIDLDVADGEFIVLVGPSGCGKSTLLRCIAGLEATSAGDIRFDGRSVVNVPTRRRNIAMVFQSYALFPHLTVAENIAFGLRLRKTDGETIRRKLDHTAELLGLSALVERYPRELSGGQRQRVAMGRAIVRDPLMFLFDEPLSNLDAKLRVQMRTEIKALRQRLGITSIYVTHDQDEAMTLADRIVVMNHGRIEQIGTPMELYEAPVNLFVAGFMGSPPMNFIALRRTAADAWTTATGETVALPPHAAAAANGGGGGGREIVLGLRPESVFLAETGSLAGTVEVVEPKGAETLVFVRLDEAHLVCVTCDKRASAAPGDRVAVGFSDEELHVFDRASGEALLQPGPQA